MGRCCGPTEMAASYNTSYTGKAYVYLGSAGGLSGSTAWTAVGVLSAG